MHDRLRMNDHVDLLRRQVEQPAGFNDFELQNPQVLPEPPAPNSAFLPELRGCACKQVSLETAQSQLDCSVLALS